MATPGEVGAGGGAGGALAAAAADLYSDQRLVPLLRALLAHGGQALAVPAGSVSLVGADGQTYSKVAERGAACGLGRTFPSDEGVTGQVLARRGPVLLQRYSALRTGHLPPEHPARSGAVVAVPIWWRGEVIGAHVAFAQRARRFSAVEVDRLELLSQVAASAIVLAGAADPAFGHLLPRAPHPVLVPADPPPGPAAAGPVPDGRCPLTRREHEVLALLARGLTDRQVAEALVVARKTVEKHVGAVLRKTGARAGRRRWCTRCEQGWLPR